MSFSQKKKKERKSEQNKLNSITIIYNSEIVYEVVLNNINNA